jgi:hypothetical protein
MTTGGERQRGSFKERPASMQEPLLIGQLEEQLFEVAHILSLD